VVDAHDAVPRLKLRIDEHFWRAVDLAVRNAEFIQPLF